MKAPRNPFDPAAKKAALFEILDATARHGKTCPTLDKMSELLAIPVSRISEMMQALRDERRVSWEMVYYGAGTGWVRIVTITGTGAVTARPAIARSVWGVNKDLTLRDRTELERAKTALRKLGPVVFDAEVIGGPKGLVKVDNKYLKPAEVIALAQSRGAIP